MGFRNPLSTASAVDTRTAAGGAGVRAYQQTTGTLSYGVLEYLTGVTGVDPATLALLATGVEAGGPTSFELTGAGHHSVTGPKLALKVEQSAGSYLSRASVAATEVILGGKVTGSSTVLDSKVIARSYAPSSSTIAANGSRQSGIGADPAIANIVTGQACTALVIAGFRASPAAAGGATIPTVYVNGVSIGSGVIRQAVDETHNVFGVADLTAGANSLSLRVDASIVAANWTSSWVAALLGNHE